MLAWDTLSRPSVAWHHAQIMWCRKSNSTLKLCSVRGRASTCATFHDAESETTVFCLTDAYIKHPAMVTKQPMAERSEIGFRKIITETTMTTTTLKLPATEYVTPDTTLSSQKVDRLSRNAMKQLDDSTKTCHGVACVANHVAMPEASEIAIIGINASNAGGATSNIVLNTSSFFVSTVSDFAASALLRSFAAPFASRSAFLSFSLGLLSREASRSLSLRRRDAYTI
mmetsp:Transcript_3871/g.10655  ORF Transcript_3871/g.10655 Transcript_3871/m.10655 type:complete len:227 (-) Transcript_3871:452-1132(-)